MPRGGPYLADLRVRDRVARGLVADVRAGRWVLAGVGEGAEGLFDEVEAYLQAVGTLDQRGLVEVNA